MLVEAFQAYSMQVGDCSCRDGYEPEGREFESLKAHHVFKQLPLKSRLLKWVHWIQ